jgi:hypothetical protein
MSEKVLESKKLSTGVRFRHFITRSEGDSWEVKQWKKGKIEVEFSDAVYSFVIDHEDVGPLSIQELTDIAKVAKEVCDAHDVEKARRQS